MSLSADTSAAMARHRERGRTFEAAGVRSFVYEVGEGEPVLLVHGVPASSFLYRKVADALAEKGLRAIAFDLPGLGFAERPVDFDYSWSGLGQFAVAAADALGLDRFHLVIHDIGGPVGLELAAADPTRIRSLTILNTMIAVDGFKKPWVMRPFGTPVVGEAWLAMLNRFSMVPLMWGVGVKNPHAFKATDVGVYARQLKLDDGGKAFLKIMRGFETTAEKQRRYVELLRGADFPIEIVWGKDDPALSLGRFGADARRLMPGANFTAVSGRHFLQEEQPEAIAQRIAAAAAAARQQ
ncbi:MAG: alpha/beta fold hydrolase [Thermoleophilaceae bacterium]|nr:alpha/beta fold hydrolase [Thermoleophilaceae bacterium]